VVSREGKAYPLVQYNFGSRVLHSVRMKPLGGASFQMTLDADKAWVIGIVPDQILTRKLSMPVRRDDRGGVISDPQMDILKMAVIERHHASGNIGRGLVKGFGLRVGALAGSVAHDSHNIVVVGVTDGEMRLAAETIAKMQGGFAVAEGGEVKACLPLPVAGLMSLESAEAAASQMEKIKEAARALGAIPANPFLTLSFLALPVIPELKLTDLGLVDVSDFRIIPLESF
jgi:adenine deaminase